MGIESVNGIWDLNDLWPLRTDARSTDDDHHRLTKSAIKKTFPGLSSTVVVSHTQLNAMTGVAATAQDANNLQDALTDLSATVQAVQALHDSTRANSISKSAAVTSYSAEIADISATFVSYIGIIDSPIGTGSVWPSGWTLAASASGKYNVVHNLGNNQPAIRLARACQTIKTAPLVIETRSANGFSISYVGYEGSASPATASINFIVNFPG